MLKRILKHLSRTQFIAVGFLIIILTGTVLLMLPISSRSSTTTPFLDALFTATSATCVTGLVVKDTFTHWSYFGQGVILLMIQIGGLGFITIGVFLATFLRKKIGLSERGLAQESMNTLQIGGVVRMVKNIVRGTFFFEGIGALILSCRFMMLGTLDVLESIYYGIFHSVSAFCNAGFDLFGRFEEYSSLVSFVDDPIVNITIMSLIIIGGIGFIVWEDLRIHRFKVKHYMLHTKIVLSTTIIITLISSAIFFILEYHHAMADLSFFGKIWASLFASVTARTAGFNTIDVASLTTSSKMLTNVLMFIGGSPGSTAGGIKTTTFTILIFSIWSMLRQKTGCNIFKRRIEDHTIRKASIVFILDLSLAIMAVIAISAIESFLLEDILLEVFSAIGTVGMSTGITRSLGVASRIVIILLMYCGRLGSLSFALFFAEKKKAEAVKLPVEKITIG